MGCHMKWEGLNLHIENPVPGVTTLVLLLALLPKAVLDANSPSAASALLGYTFVAGGVFVAASYLVGIFTVAICRCIIDPISAAWPRPFFFRWFYRERFQAKTNAEINQAYRDPTQVALVSDSEYKRSEIKNRRERGRLLRSGMFPMALAVWWVAGDLSVWAKIPIQIGGMAIGVFLYAYVELTIYQESGLAETK
jgi:hypothetical protein